MNNLVLRNSSFTCPTNAEDVCTLSTCPLDCASVEYIPSLGGNAAYAAIFALILAAQVGLGVWYKTWGFLVGMFFGLILEIVGYVGRILLHNNPFNSNNFLIYLVTLTIAPAFLSASIYLCLSRIIIVYGAELSRFKVRTIALSFMFADFVSLVLQAAGGAIASSAEDGDKDQNDLGRNIMIAGLVWQVVSLGLYMLVWGDFTLRVRRKGTSDAFGSGLRHLRSFKRFHYFQYALWLATILIFIRSIYRVVELQGGFDGAIANNEAAFMVFEGPMIIVGMAALTVFHPGYSFAGEWSQAAWSLRGKKKGDAEGIPLK